MKTRLLPIVTGAVLALTVGQASADTSMKGHFQWLDIDGSPGCRVLGADDLGTAIVIRKRNKPPIVIAIGSRLECPRKLDRGEEIVVLRIERYTVEPYMFTLFGKKGLRMMVIRERPKNYITKAVIR